MRIYFIVCLFSLFMMGVLPLTNAHEFQVGQSVILKAAKPVGVPIHREPAPSFLQHVPSGTTGIIENISKNNQWLSLRLSSGETGWVHDKYVETSSKASPSPGPAHTTPHLPSDSPQSRPVNIHIGEEEAVWTSREQCQTALGKGARMAPETAQQLRIGTWNIRWFPLGAPPDQPEDFAEATDLDWITCVIQWMQIDVLAVQEILATPEATQALQTVTGNLTDKTGHTWKWYRQPCGHLDDHHIALLWNDSRVSLTNFESLWEFNSKAGNGSNPCTYGLRPGQYAHVQSRTTNGVDFHLIAIHLKSGPTVFDVEERHKALNRIDQAIAPYLKQDQDVVILGDFNTMGAGDWNSRDYEIKNLRRHLEKEKPGFSDLEPRPQCSHYFRGRGGWLDHILVPHNMKEITLKSTTVTGYCALTGCQRIRGDYPSAYRQLSDHCPVVMEIQNTDQD